MKKEIDEIIQYVSNKYIDLISKNGNNYIELNIGNLADMLGHSNVKKKFKTEGVIVPLKQHVNGMKVRIDGRTFVKYSQFESGIALPGHLAKESGLPRKPYVADENMILNCA